MSNFVRITYYTTHVSLFVSYSTVTLRRENVPAFRASLNEWQGITCITNLSNM